MHGAAFELGAASGRPASRLCASSGCRHGRATQRRLQTPCCASKHGGMNSMQPSTPPEYIATPTPLAERTNWQQPQPQQRRQPPSWKRPFQGRGSSRPRQQPADRWEEVLISPSVPIPRYVRFITARLLDAPPASAHLLLLANHAPAATRAVTVLAAVDQVLAAQGGVALLQPAVVDNSSGSRSRGSRSGEAPSQQWQQPAGQPSGAAPWQRPAPSAGGGAREVGQDGAAVPQLRLYLRMWPRGEGASPYHVAAPQEHPLESASNAAASRAGSAAAGSPPAAAASGEGAGSSGTGGPPPLYALGSPGRMGRTHLTSRATVPAQQAAYVLQDLMTKRGCYVAAAGGLAAANALLVLGKVRSSLLRSSTWADMVVRVDKVLPGGSGQAAAPQQQQQQQTTPGVDTLQRDQEQEDGAGVGEGGSSEDGQAAGADGSSSSSSGAVVYRFTVVKAIRTHPGCRWPVPLAPVGPGWAPVRHVRAAEEAAAAAAAAAGQARALKPQQRRKPWRRNKQQQQQQP